MTTIKTKMYGIVEVVSEYEVEGFEMCDIIQLKNYFYIIYQSPYSGKFYATLSGEA